MNANAKIQHCTHVIHVPTCPRYRGGVCRPEPEPVEPYTDEERYAVESYIMALTALDVGKGDPVVGVAVTADGTPHTFSLVPGSRSMVTGVTGAVRAKS